jgi:hypothetical protein
MTAKIAFAPGDKENRFDFAFPSFSKDQPPQIAAPPPGLSTGNIQPLRSGPPAAAVAALLTDLKAREAEVSSLVKSGSFGGIYLPALQAKDLALEIQSKAPNQAVEGPVRQLVVSAYQLDNYGDLGDREKIDDAYGRFSAAVSELELLIVRR